MENPHIREINHDCYFRITASPQMCINTLTFSQPNVTFKTVVLIACTACHKNILHPCLTWVGHERNKPQSEISAMLRIAVMCLTSCCPHSAGETAGLVQRRHSRPLTCCLVHRGGRMKSHIPRGVRYRHRMRRTTIRVFFSLQIFWYFHKPFQAERMKIQFVCANK